MTLKLYGGKRSRTIRPLWFAEEVGLEIEHHAEHPHGEAVAALNPLKQVPVLVDGEAVVTDSTTILHWLADREGKLTYPHTTADRARLEARINFVISDLEAPLWLWSRRQMAAKFFGAPEPRDALLDELKADFAAAEAKFAGLLGSAEFFAGDTFTIADIVAGHVGFWSANTGFEPQTSAFADYVQRVTSRPALARAQGD